MAKEKPLPAAEREPEVNIGFGNVISSRNRRLLLPDGSFNVRRIGGRLRDLNLYQWMLGLSWGAFFGIVLLAYILVNCLFASLYVAIGVENLSDLLPEVAEPMTLGQQFAHAFYFSSQTLTTVGYGAISPMGAAANIVAAFQAMTGIMMFAIATGLLYGRFSRPSARIGYSQKALIAPYQDGKALMIRVVNLRSNQLTEMEAQLVLMGYDSDGAGERQRFYPLPLVIRSLNLFPLNWTLVHPLDAQSPLSGKTPADLEAMHAEILVILKGYDETFAQTVSSRHSYKWHEIEWNARFQRMFRVGEEGALVLELGKLSDFEPAP